MELVNAGRGERQWPRVTTSTCGGHWDIPTTESTAVTGQSSTSTGNRSRRPQLPSQGRQWLTSAAGLAYGPASTAAGIALRSRWSEPSQGLELRAYGDVRRSRCASPRRPRMPKPEGQLRQLHGDGARVSGGGQPAGLEVVSPGRRQSALHPWGRVRAELILALLFVVKSR